MGQVHKYIKNLQIAYLEKIFVDASRFVPQTLLDDIQIVNKKYNVLKKAKLISKELKEAYNYR